MILPTYPGKVPQTPPNPTKKEIPSETDGEGSGVSSRGMWVRSYPIDLDISHSFFFDSSLFVNGPFGFDLKKRPVF